MQTASADRNLAARCTQDVLTQWIAGARESEGALLSRLAAAEAGATDADARARSAEAAAARHAAAAAAAGAAAARDAAVAADACAARDAAAAATAAVAAEAAEARAAVAGAASARDAAMAAASASRARAEAMAAQLSAARTDLARTRDALAPPPRHHRSAMRMLRAIAAAADDAGADAYRLALLPHAGSDALSDREGYGDAGIASDSETGVTDDGTPGMVAYPVLNPAAQRELVRACVQPLCVLWRCLKRALQC